MLEIMPGDLVAHQAAPAGAGVADDPPPLRRRLGWIVAAALLIRLLSMLLLRTYRLHEAADESMRIAASLAQGQGFSNPFPAHTGPTAWLPPLYPFLLGGVYRLFGVYSRASDIVALGLNCVFGALTTIPVYFSARRSFGDRVAVWSAWTWALLPYTIYWAVHAAWDTCLSALLLSIVFFLTLELGRQQPPWKWALYGFTWGIMALSNTAALAFLPFAAAWIAGRALARRRGFLLPGTAAALVFLAVITPWIARDYAIFHRFIPIRGNFGVELHLGNSPGANGTWQWWLHPTQNVLELSRYEQLGEPAYVAEKQRQAMDFIRAHPGRFAVLSVERFVYYWAGAPRAERYAWVSTLRSSLFLASSVLAIWGIAMAVAGRRAGAWLYLLLLVSVPTIYYFVFPHARYRHPIEPELLIAAVYLIAETRPGTSFPREL